VRLEQQEPPDADEGSGEDEEGDGPPGVGGGQFPAECVGDRVRGTELSNRSLGGFGVGESVIGAVADGVVEAIAEFREDLLPAAAWPRSRAARSRQ